MKKKRRKLKKKYFYLFNGIFLLFLLGLFMMLRAGYQNYVDSKETNAATNDKSSNKKNLQYQKLEKQLEKNWLTIDKGTDIPISVAVFLGGHIISYQTEDELNFRTASIVKVSIASLLLHQKGQAISSQEYQFMSDMIKYSDNDSATELLMDSLGGMSSLNKLYKDLSMKNTRVNTYAWGYTETTAEDQVKLLNMIFNDSKYLNSKSKDFLVGLMGSVSSDQDWGVGSINDEHYVKNGWLPDDDGWIVNSIGSITFGPSDNDHYQLAILTKENNSLDDGIDLVEQIAQNTNKIINAKKRT